MTDDVKERVARAIYGAYAGDPDDCDADELSRVSMDVARDDAHAAISALRPGDEINGCVLRPRTIYDRRGEIDTALWNAAPELFAALRDLLYAVEERCGLHQSIESATIARAHNAINIAAAKEIAR